MITRRWLALRRRLPWSLMGFLSDAHRRGVLRQAGAVYQFRHIEMQDRLASRPFHGLDSGPRQAAVLLPSVIAPTPAPHGAAKEAHNWRISPPRLLPT